MDTPPPIPSQQVVVIPPPKSGCGCFAGGCMSLFFFAGLGLIALIGVCWFFSTKVLKNFTADAPAEVALTMPSDGEFNAANAKLSQLKNAMQTNQATSVAFSAGDLNALIARHPDFAKHRKRLHVAIADSVATLEMSVPLTSIKFPGMRSRWFNGSARLRFSYDDNNFTFDPDWIEAGGHEFTGGFLRSLASSFGRRFTVDFEDSLRKNDESTLWPRVKTITLQGDQFIVTTEGPPGT
jgi:hypothetical protein